MTDYNLPPGCRVVDLPGNSTAEVHAERYAEEHYADTALYLEFLAEVSGGVISGDDTAITFLIGWFDDMWSDWLYDRGLKDYRGE